MVAVNFVHLVSLTPVVMTTVPCEPLVGMKLVIYGITRNFLLLFNVRLGVATVTKPVVAPFGTLVLI